MYEQSENIPGIEMFSPVCKSATVQLNRLPSKEMTCRERRKAAAWDDFGFGERPQGLMISSPL